MSNEQAIWEVSHADMTEKLAVYLDLFAAGDYAAADTAQAAYLAAREEDDRAFKAYLAAL
jgi:hypothetical protein